ncbi:ABC transporter permease (plasmid) [Mesorhizobium atlanticum]
MLLATFGYGISFDIENLRYAVLDRDQSVESRLFLEQFSHSRYFVEQSPLTNEFEIDNRLRSGELRFAVDIPPGFGRDLLHDRQPQVTSGSTAAIRFRRRRRALIFRVRF